MQTCVQNDGEYSEPYPVTHGAKLFSIFLPCSQMLFRTVMLVFLSGTALMASYSKHDSNDLTISTKRWRKYTESHTANQLSP